MGHHSVFVCKKQIVCPMRIGDIVYLLLECALLRLEVHVLQLELTSFISASFCSIFLNIVIDTVMVFVEDVY